MKMKIWEKLLAAGSIVVSVSVLVFLTALGPGTVTFPNTIPYGVTFGAGGEFHSTTAIVSNSNPDLGINIGQQVMTGSLPVVISSNQSAIPVSQSGAWAVTANLGTLNGAATAAKQPALGTAGTPSTDVGTIQGIASGTPVAVSGGYTDGASTASAQYSPISAVNAAGLSKIIQCDSSIAYDASTSGATQLVALSSSKKVYICGYTIFSAGTANVKFVYGTGTNCGTGTINMTPAFQLTAQTGAVDGSPFWRGLATAASNALCINSNAAVAVQAIVYYTQL